MRSAVRLTITEKARITEERQVSALHRQLLADGIGDPSPDEGLRVEYEPDTGILRVEADRDVTEQLEAWALSPPPSERQRIKDQIAAATTVVQLRAAVAEAISGGLIAAETMDGT